MLWLASFPRSGNTFFRIILHEVYGVETTEFAGLDFRGGLIRKGFEQMKRFSWADTAARVLETYEEARLLLEAKGWGVTKAAEHLAEMPEMAPFHISHTKFSRKTITAKGSIKPRWQTTAPSCGP